MLPRMTGGDMANSRKADSVARGDAPVWRAFMNQPSNLDDIIVGQPVLVVARSGEASASLNHVSHIVGGGSDNEMVRIDAQPVIAGVPNQQVVGYCTVSHFVHEPMRPQLATANPELAVSGARCDATSPYPATVGLFDATPETDSRRLACVLARTTTEPAGPTAMLARCQVEFYAATETSERDMRGILPGHRDSSSRCRAGGVTSAARRPHALNFTIQTPNPATIGGR